MSQLESSPAVASESHAATSYGDRWRRLESLLNRASDGLNPILVKEARQAMKSRQFAVTFTLVLVCAWAWSFLGVALMSPGIYYAPGGRFMLSGYYFIMAFPLTIIAPFSAFRSLASEREDGTYELLSISTLAPWQIVGGKLGSTVLQMVVYLSALSPCVAFTYLLRGVDILLLAFVVALVFLASLFLSAVGLLLATLTKAKHWQVVLSVATIVGLVVVFIYFSIFVSFVIIGQGMIPLDQSGFWIGVAVFLSFYLSLLTLVLLAASARITFASDNRSTRLRIAMLVQYILLVGWFMSFWAYRPDEDVLWVFLFFAALHWSVMGMFMIGESQTISPRVKRSLPKSFLGRVFLTWFFPGPATGYFFAVASMLSATVLVMFLATQPLLAGVLSELTGSGRMVNVGMGWDIESLLLLAWVTMCYMVIYLGLARLIVTWLSRWYPTGVVASCAICVLLVAIGTLAPLTLQFSLRGSIAGAGEYTMLQASNVFWTIEELLSSSSISLAWPAVPVLLGFTALVVFGASLYASAAEIIPSRVAIPQRVQEDELQLHPEKAPKPPGPSSPWDDQAD